MLLKSIYSLLELFSLQESLINLVTNIRHIYIFLFIDIEKSTINYCIVQIFSFLRTLQYWSTCCFNTVALTRKFTLRTGNGRRVGTLLQLANFYLSTLLLSTLLHNLLSLLVQCISQTFITYKTYIYREYVCILK